MIVSTQVHHGAPGPLPTNLPVCLRIGVARRRPCAAVQICRSCVKTVRVVRPHTAAYLERVRRQGDRGVICVCIARLIPRSERCLLDRWRLEAAVEGVVSRASAAPREGIGWAEHVSRLRKTSMLVSHISLFVAIVSPVGLRVSRRHIVVGLDPVAAVRSVVGAHVSPRCRLVDSLLILVALGVASVIAVLAVAVITSGVRSTMPWLPKVVINLHFESPLALF